mmetsp:Transcript_4378/g.13031  ORF Transcript_4378/g.13031 Transcript_4378/m.13031 type:complete len:309 (-) Transcript_4378:375-1301(-)
MPKTASAERLCSFLLIASMMRWQWLGGANERTPCRQGLPTQGGEGGGSPEDMKLKPTGGTCKRAHVGGPDRGSPLGCLGRCPFAGDHQRGAATALGEEGLLCLVELGEDGISILPGHGLVQHALDATTATPRVACFPGAAGGEDAVELLAHAHRITLELVSDIGPERHALGDADDARFEGHNEELRVVLLQLSPSAEAALLQRVVSILRCRRVMAAGLAERWLVVAPTVGAIKDRAVSGPLGHGARRGQVHGCQGGREMGEHHVVRVHASRVGRVEMQWEHVARGQGWHRRWWWPWWKRILLVLPAPR